MKNHSVKKLALAGILCAVAAAFAASLLRNVLGLGSLMAFPGSMCGALLCGLTPETYTVYIVPFLISTAAGSLLAGALVFALEKRGALKTMRSALEH